MGKFGFLRQLTFVRLYFLLEAIILVLTLVFNLFGFSGDLILQSIAGIFTLVGIPLLIGEILLIISTANKGNKIGWILVRISYLTLIVACLGLLLITIGTLLFALTFSASMSQLFSIVGFTILVAFGIFLSVLSYYTLSIESAWSLKNK